MPTTPTATQDEADLMALYAPDVVTFDLMPPHQVPDAAHYRKNFERWFAVMPGPIDYELHDLRLTLSDSVAFCHSLSHIKGTRANGEKTDYDESRSRAPALAVTG